MRIVFNKTGTPTEYYNVSDIKNRMGVCLNTAYNMIKTGRLPPPAHKVGNRYYYTREELDQIGEIHDKLREVQQQLDSALKFATKKPNTKKAK